MISTFSEQRLNVEVVPYAEMAAALDPAEGGLDLGVLDEKRLRTQGSRATSKPV